MCEWSLVAQGDAVLEIRDSNRVSGKKKIIIIITRQLQLQATVKRFLFDLYFDLEGQQTFTSLWFRRQVTKSRYCESDY